jgi:hypothetical protein
MKKVVFLALSLCAICGIFAPIGAHISRNDEAIGLLLSQSANENEEQKEDQTQE